MNLVPMNESNNKRISARDLMVKLDYAEWRNFEKVVEKAEAFFTLVHGEEAGRAAFVEVNKMVPGLNNSTRQVRDWSLSVEAALACAADADSSKESVALVKAELVAARVQVAKQAPPEISPLMQMCIAYDAQQRELWEHHVRISELEAANDPMRQDYMTILAYAILRGIKLSNQTMSQLGKSCTKLCEEKMLGLRFVPSDSFGRVKAYPPQVIAEAFASVEF